MMICIPLFSFGKFFFFFFFNLIQRGKEAFWLSDLMEEWSRVREPAGLSS
jgi:hypothetical protein